MAKDHVQLFLGVCPVWHQQHRVSVAQKHWRADLITDKNLRYFFHAIRFADCCQLCTALLIVTVAGISSYPFSDIQITNHMVL